MNGTTTTRSNENFGELPLANAVAIARVLSKINRLRRVHFKPYPGMDHVSVKILLHIFLGQNGSMWAIVDDIAEAVGIRPQTVQRYIHFLAGVSLAETVTNSTGVFVRARLSQAAIVVVSSYLEAIAALVSPPHDDRH